MASIDDWRYRPAYIKLDSTGNVVGVDSPFNEQPVPSPFVPGEAANGVVDHHAYDYDTPAAALVGNGSGEFVRCSPGRVGQRSGVAVVSSFPVLRLLLLSEYKTPAAT